MSKKHPINEGEHAGANSVNSTDENMDFDNNKETEDESKLEQSIKCTPSVIKTRQSRMEFKISSPSDSLMSPCTKILAGGGSRKPKNAISHPQNVLRNKQHKDLLRKLPED